MNMNIEDLFLSAIAISVITTTISKSTLFRPIRARLPEAFFKSLANCPYCLAHWVSPLAAAYLANSFFPDFIIISFALVALSSLFTYPLILYIRWLDNV